LKESRAHCRRCLLPEGMFHVRLDASGLCNYCRHWDETRSAIFDFEKNRPLLLDRLARYRGRLHYDAAVGLSGGKDSTYVLHCLKKGYGANVLAITFDNGFFTDYAWQNIRSIQRATGVDHVVYRPDWEVYADLYRAAIRRFGDPCFACSVGGYVLSVRGCRDLRIPFFIHGRSPMQMLRHWRSGTRDLGMGILAANLLPHDPEVLRARYRALIRRLKMLLVYLMPNPTRRRRVLRELLGAGIRRGDVVPEFLAFFLFEPYDEVAIVDHLERLDVGYRRPENHAILGHGDCLIHDSAADLYRRQHGVSRVLPDVAAMLRQGATTQEEAREILTANTPSEEDVETSIGHLLERIDMSRAEYDRIANRLSRRAGRMPLA